MTDLDLTEAVDAAARRLYDQSYREIHGAAWEDAPGWARHTCGELVLPFVSAAAPSIAAQVRAETLREAAEAIELIPVTSIRVAEGIGLASQTLRQLAASPAPTDEDPTP